MDASMLVVVSVIGAVAVFRDEMGARPIREGDRVYLGRVTRIDPNDASVGSAASIRCSPVKIRPALITMINVMACWKNLSAATWAFSIRSAIDAETSIRMPAWIGRLAT